MNLWLNVTVAWCVTASPAFGQDPWVGLRYEIHGTVYDSIAGAPLAGAVVHVATRDPSRVPYSTRADSVGRFAVPNLPAGSYVVGFYHDNLTALGLDAPLTAVELGPESTVTVNLWIPSAPVVRVMRCGVDYDSEAKGMLVGFVRDGVNGLVVRGAVLRLSWRALALDSASYRTVTERTTATISADGSFLACRLPVDATLDLEVQAPGYRTLAGTVARIPAGGIGRLDLALVDTTRSHGTARIHGRVSTPLGTAVTTGQAVIAALGLEVPIRGGEFLLSGVPAGSWVVEARTIGTEPQSVLVSVVDHATTEAQMQVGEMLQRLDAVTILGERNANMRVLEEVLRRKRLGAGTVFLPGSPALRSAIWISDVMREARGFTYAGADLVSARSCGQIAVYVDDVLQPDGFIGLNTSVTPREVLAIETFPDILLAPVQYRIMKTALGSADTQYCAVVLIWTKNRPRR